MSCHNFQINFEKYFFCLPGNARGTQVSRRHLHLNPNGWRQKEYWSFSWHEIGAFDLPASIDYILNETKFNKLNYIGWSQGSISFFVMASIRPEYNDKIIQANLLAPVATLKGTRNPFYNSFAQSYKKIKMLPQTMKIYKIILNNDVLLNIAETACKNAVDSTPKKCKLILTALNSNQINCVSCVLILQQKEKLFIKKISFFLDKLAIHFSGYPRWCFTKAGFALPAIDSKWRLSAI